MGDLSKVTELADQVEEGVTATVDLLGRYAELAGLLEGALRTIVEMTSGEAYYGPGEVADYARDVLARAGCEPAQAGR